METKTMQDYLNALETAYNHLDNMTDPDGIDMAIYEIQVAEKAMSRFIKEQKTK